MRFFLFSLFVALLFAAVLATAPQKAVIISYPEETPQSVIEKAMAIIREAGGVITHEYTIFKGFAAKSTATALETIKTLGEEYVPLIEDDSIVQIDGSVKIDKRNH